VISCPNCNRIIMDTTQDGGYKVRSRMILFKDGKAVALCPTCKHNVPIPVVLGNVDTNYTKPKLIIKQENL
jgi:hypothetical protein